MRNKPISRFKVRQLLFHFATDLPASKTAVLIGVNRNTVNRYYALIREKILAHQMALARQVIGGEIEIDESYFGPRRVKGKRGRGAGEKTPVLGILKRQGIVFVAIVPNCSKKELLPIITGKVEKGATINSDRWKAYDSLVIEGYEHHRVNHGKNEFARGKCHINGLESFWSYAKRRMAKFNGLYAEAFPIHLKETEFRFNYRKGDDLFEAIVDLFYDRPVCGGCCQE
jgi:transposase-like protein